jgi:hypothetical protein
MKCVRCSCAQALRDEGGGLFAVKSVSSMDGTFSPLLLCVMLDAMNGVFSAGE